MATRQETARQRAEIENQLREQLRRGRLSPGERLPSVREIAQQFGVTNYLAHTVLKMLADEGALESTRGRGTIVGKRERSRDKRFLLITDDGEIWPNRRAMQTGFEDRIAELGGVSGVLSWGRLLQSVEQIAVAGIFHLTAERDNASFAPGGALPGLARVRFADKVFHQADPSCDLVSFDDIGGGLEATNALLGYGHERIAFLGLHPRKNPLGHYGWSAQREEGWRLALHSAGIESCDWSFLPRQIATETNQTEIARGVAWQLLRVMRRDDAPFAVVAANDCAALGILAALEDANIRREEWPAIVGFDSSEASQKLGLTSLRLPWESVGRQAAELVWNRSDPARGQNADPQHAQTEMRLITRTSCARGWARDFSDERLASPPTATPIPTSPNVRSALAG